MVLTNYVPEQETPKSAYEPPALRVLGSVHELTLVRGCKLNGHADGFTFTNNRIVCRST